MHPPSHLTITRLLRRDIMEFPRGGRAMESPAPGEQQQQSSTSRYKGIWLRQWGSWVAEVRIPNSRERLWLGSYPTPEQAARAFDTAVYCLRGPGAAFNFPDQLPHIPSAHKLSREEIKAAAMRFALEGPGRTGEAKEGGGEMTMEVVGEGEGNSWTMAGEAQEGGGAMTTEAVRPGEGLSGTMAEPVEALTEIDSTAGVWGRWDEEDECYWAAVHSGDDDIYRSSPLWNFPL